jgi:multidrug transporter EmrE-like cation transporter
MPWLFLSTAILFEVAGITAIRSPMPVSGVGTALAALIGVVYFREPVTALKLASLALVVLGVVGSRLPPSQCTDARGFPR